MHHVGLPPQLRDLDAVLGETNDLGRSPEHAGIRARCEAELRKIVAPEEANARAFRGQAATVERLGGEAAVLARGDVGCTSAPGQKPEFR